MSLGSIFRVCFFPVLDMFFKCRFRTHGDVFKKIKRFFPLERSYL